MLLELWILIGFLVVSVSVGLFFLFQEKQKAKSESKKIEGAGDNNERPGLEKLDIKNPEAQVLKKELERVIIGQEGMIHGLLLGLFSGKHVLIQSLPGMAKTTAVKALAQAVGLEFGRVQGTPDLLPSDIIGLEMAHSSQLGLRPSEPPAPSYRKGPIFANIVLFDEINRTTPKVQSAFIQAMEEGQVTLGHETIDLPKPFVVFATCNPLGSKGVYDLPEAQLDRFGLSIKLDYPKNEKQIISEKGSRLPAPSNQFIDFEAAYRSMEQIEVSEEVIDYITGIIQKTRNMPELIKVGCSPRAGKDLLWLTKTAAFLAGKKSADIQDVDVLIESVLYHRVVREKNVISKDLFGFL